MKLKVGDKVLIKTWDAMVEEFGLKYGNINCNETFVENMKYMCGKEFVLNKNKVNEKTVIDGWVISPDMVEKIIDKVERKINNNTFSVKRELSIEIITYEGDNFMRIREIAGVLGVKQQYEFTSDIKKTIGKNKVLNGDDTVEFRTQDDERRTVFINTKDLLLYLLNGTNIPHKIIPSKKEEMINELIKLNRG